MKKPKKHEDLSGRPIEVGDYIAYAALWSRSATLKYGRVTELVTKKKDYAGKWERCIKLQIVSVDQGLNAWELQGIPWQQKYGDQKIDFKKAKVQTLEFLDRLLVVSSVQVPDAARALLDKAYWARIDRG